MVREGRWVVFLVQGGLAHGPGDLGGYGDSRWSVGGFSVSGVVLNHGDGDLGGYGGSRWSVGGF